MARNHEFINFSLLAIRQAIKNDSNFGTENDWPSICSAFNIFTESLIAHMNNEDSNCYNQADLKTDCNPLFYRLISDHMNIRKLIGECQLQINLNERSQFTIIFSQLDQLIEEHTIREENLMGLNANNLETSTIQVIEALQNIHINRSSKF